MLDSYTVAMTTADHKIKEALDRWKAECEAANAAIARRQADGSATKDEWLKFSERIRKAAEQLMAEYAIIEKRSDQAVNEGAALHAGAAGFRRRE